MKSKYFVLIGTVLLLLTMTVGNNTPVDVSLEQVAERSTHAELTPHGQLIITNDTGLAAWPGAGTAEEPYVISGINITLDDQCVSISNTNSHFVIRDSYFHYNGTGSIMVTGFFNANNSRIEDCTIIGSWASIYHHDSYNCNISSNLIRGHISTNNQGVRITHNTINMLQKSSAYGIRILKDAHSAYLFNNTIIGNVVYEIGFGINVEESNNVTVLENSLSGINGTAIQFQASHNASITENTISECKQGIIVSLSSFADIRNNLAYDGIFGVTVLGNCTVVGNSVFHNEIHDIYVGQFNNTLYGNFIGLALGSSAANFWDDGISIGNYWLDYDGEGTYTVPGDPGGIDHYPKVFVESTITHPADLVIEHGKSVGITWHANGTLPESEETFKDGNISSLSVWDGSPLWVEYSGLTVGEHIIEQTFHFASRMSVSDSVTVTVEEASGPSIVLTQVAGLAWESVEVSAEVSDISGVDAVILSYSVDSSTWTNVTMSESGGYWDGTIPGQAVDTVVEYKVYAWDNLGHLTISDTKSYTTQAGPVPPPMTLYMIAGAGVAAVVVVGGVVMKRR